MLLFVISSTTSSCRCTLWTHKYGMLFSPPSLGAFQVRSVMLVRSVIFPSVFSHLLNSGGSVVKWNRTIACCSKKKYSSDLPFAFDADTYPRYVEGQIQINARCFYEMPRGNTQRGFVLAILLVSSELFCNHC